MRLAFAGFEVDKVAGFDETAFERLMADPGIIRNRLKVRAIIANAGNVQRLRQSHGGFADWIDAHHPRDKPAWVKLFRQTFDFTGGEIVGEFLMSLGWLPGAHAPGCQVGQQIGLLNPPWQRA